MELFQMDTVKLQTNMNTTSQVGATELKSVAGENEGMASATEANSNYRYDTLDLSEGYLNFKTKDENSSADGDTNLQNSSELSPQKSIISEEIQNAIEQLTGNSQKADDSSDYEDLSGYTSMELRALFQEGKITASQYNDEASARADVLAQSDPAPQETKAPDPAMLKKQPEPAQANQLF
ncbi:hypothetical protein Q5O24_06420 [Eubacteriaceae bacterium ES3]|nr:hypothetical protein Q5O24_06420 [Eubacteriaceae bacterium ES3]